MYVGQNAHCVSSSPTNLSLQPLEVVNTIFETALESPAEEQTCKTRQHCLYEACILPLLYSTQEGEASRRQGLNGEVQKASALRGLPLTMRGKGCTSLCPFPLEAEEKTLFEE